MQSSIEVEQMKPCRDYANRQFIVRINAIDNNEQSGESICYFIKYIIKLNIFINIIYIHF